MLPPRTIARAKGPNKVAVSCTLTRAKLRPVPPIRPFRWAVPITNVASAALRRKGRVRFCVLNVAAPRATRSAPSPRELRLRPARDGSLREQRDGREQHSLLGGRASGEADTLRRLRTEHIQIPSRPNGRKRNGRSPNLAPKISTYLACGDGSAPATSARASCRQSCLGSVSLATGGACDNPCVSPVASRAAQASAESAATHGHQRKRSGGCLTSTT